MKTKVKYSVIIPTMWMSDKIYKMLSIYEQSQYVQEVIIIDNAPEKWQSYLSSFSKIRRYTKGRNIYVNPAWNWGVSLAKYNLILANDDVIIEKLDVLLECVSKIDYGIIGGNLDKCKEDTQVQLTKIECKHYSENYACPGYGCFLFVKNYIFIPEDLKIIGGDHILFEHAINKYIFSGIKMISEERTTRKSQDIFAQIEAKDSERLKLYENKN